MTLLPEQILRLRALRDWLRRYEAGHEFNPPLENPDSLAFKAYVARREAKIARLRARVAVLT